MNRFAWAAGAMLMVSGCDAYECGVAPAEPIALGRGCWDDPECTLETETEQNCGRAYRCPVEQINGSTADVCVVATDCDCVDELESVCGVEVEVPGFCER